MDLNTIVNDPLSTLSTRTHVNCTQLFRRAVQMQHDVVAGVLICRPLLNVGTDGPLRARDGGGVDVNRRGSAPPVATTMREPRSVPFYLSPQSVPNTHHDRVEVEVFRTHHLPFELDVAHTNPCYPHQHVTWRHHTAGIRVASLH